MQLHWTPDWEYVGNAFGYTVHQKNLKAGLERAGVTFSEDSPVAFHIVPANAFEPIPGKFNILFTMYECVTIPDPWIAKLAHADMLIVPCVHNKKLFARYYAGPIEVAQEGVDLDLFTYKERSHPGDDVFRFLWVGASNPRKGYQHVILAWNQFRKMFPELRDKTALIMKTTQIGDGAHIVGYRKGKPMRREMPRERVVRAEELSLVLDTRRLPWRHTNGSAVWDAESLAESVKSGDVWPTMTDLYHASHAFLFPTMGEGFGLTLAEAMATGLPCAYTPWSGPLDFISEKEGYPLRWDYGTVNIDRVIPNPDGSGGVIRRPDWSTEAANVDIVDLVHKIQLIYHEYDDALRRGRAARKRIEGGFTWDHHARRVIGAIKRHHP